MFQRSKIMTGLFRISYSDPRRPACVKSKVNHLAPPLPLILAVNLTFSETGYAVGRYQKLRFLENPFYDDIVNV